MITKAKTTALSAAIDYLKANPGAQPVKDVCQAAAKAAGLKGKTPEATVAAKIYLAAKKGETFKIVSRGQVELLPETSTPAAKSETPAEAAATPADKPKATREAKPHPKPSSSPKRSGRKQSVAA